LGQDLIHLHATILGHGQQQIEDLRGLQIIRRLEQQFVDRLAARFEITLELSPSAADIVRALERLHALRQRAFRRSQGFEERFTDRRHPRRLYIVRRPDQAQSAQFDSTSTLGSAMSSLVPVIAIVCRGFCLLWVTLITSGRRVGHGAANRATDCPDLSAARPTRRRSEAPPPGPGSSQCPPRPAPRRRA
jgi:hypothetical protein